MYMPDINSLAILYGKSNEVYTSPTLTQKVRRQHSLLFFYINFNKGGIIMNLSKYIPSVLQNEKNNPFFSLQNELNKAINDFHGWFEPFHFPSERFENLILKPSVDIVDNKNQFKVEVEMPGMGEEDISVSVDNGMLFIKGEKTTSKQDKDKNYRMREISYGKYERYITLPEYVDVDKAKASFKKGMLWVDFPKKTECVSKSRTITVEKV